MTCDSDAQNASWNHTVASYLGSASRSYNYSFAWSQGGNLNFNDGFVSSNSVANQSSPDSGTRVGFAVAAFYYDANSARLFQSPYRSRSCTPPSGTSGRSTEPGPDSPAGSPDPVIAGCGTPANPRITSLTNSDATVAWESTESAMMYAYTITVNGVALARSTDFTAGTTARVDIEELSDAGDALGVDVTAVCSGGFSKTATSPSFTVPVPP